MLLQDHQMPSKEIERYIYYFLAEDLMTVN